MSQTPDPVPFAEGPPIETSEPPGKNGRASASTGSLAASYRRATLLTSLGLATLAAVATWLAAESGVFVFRPAVAHYSMMGTAVVGETAATRAAASTKTAALTYGFLGASLGLALGLSGSLSEGRLRSAGLAGAVGIVAGVAAGCVVLAFLPAHERWVVDSLGEMPGSLILHAGLWVPIAIAAALAFSLGRGRVDGTARIVRAAAAGVIVFAVLFELLGAFALPLSETSDVLPGTRTARLIALAGVALSTASGAVLATRGTARP